MTNKSPHTPQTKTPSRTDETGLVGGIQQMKPITIPPEMQDLVKKINELASTVIPELEKSEEENRIRELEKQHNQLPDYIEVAGLKVLTQDLDKPQCPEIKLLKKGEEYKKCCCYELEYEGEIYYQYDFHGAKKEAKFRGIKVLSDKDWNKLEKKLGIDGLKKLLGLKNKKDYKGRCDDGIYGIGNLVHYWSSSVYTSGYPAISWSRYFKRISISDESHGESDQYECYLVRCRLKD